MASGHLAQHMGIALITTAHQAAPTVSPPAPICPAFECQRHLDRRAPPGARGAAPGRATAHPGPRLTVCPRG
jgi:hypothetical protein